MDRKDTEWRIALNSQRFSQASLTRRTLMKGLGLTLLTFVPLIQGCRAFEGHSENREAGKQEKPVELEGGTVTREAAIPPVDAAAPVRTETATFALG